jgi:hypothetical protein
VVIVRTRSGVRGAIFTMKTFPKWKKWLFKMEMSTFDKKILFKLWGLSERLISILEMYNI